MKFIFAAAALASTSAFSLKDQFHNFFGKTNVHLNLDLVSAEHGDLNIKAGDKIEITATEDRTTGYQWEMVVDTCEQNLQIKTDLYKRNGTETTKGTRSLVLTTPSPMLVGESLNGKTCRMDFVYNRSWETPKDTDVTKTILFHF